MKNLHMAAIALLLFMLNGCASSVYPFGFDTNPQGATVICDGASGIGAGNMGYTPTTAFLNKTVMKSNPNGTIDLSKCSANWASGAKVNYKGSGQAGWLLQNFPNGASQTVQRPKVAGLAQDNQFALQVQQMKTQQAMMQQQTAAMQEQAAVMQQAAIATQQMATGQAIQGLQNQVNQMNQMNQTLTQPRNTNVNIYNTGGRPTWIPVQF